MEPLAVDLRLLSDVRGAALRLLPGRALMARVVQAPDDGRGLLNIAGALIEAGLPHHVRAGDQLRLVVRQADEHRVVFELPGASAEPAPPVTVSLPGGGRLRLSEDQEERDPAGGSAGHSLSLRYDAPELGPLDLRFDLTAGALRVTVAAGAGAPFERTSAASGGLTDALSAASDRPVSVTVIPRRDPLDVYA